MARRTTKKATMVVKKGPLAHEDRGEGASSERNNG